MSYGQEKLIRSYNSAGSPWLDASMRKYATRQMQASEVDKPASSAYNNGIGYEYKPSYGKAQAMPSFEKGGGTAQRGGRIHNHTYKSPAYARQMSYRGMQRGAYNTDKPGDRRNVGTNREFPTYSPQTQQAIIKDGLDSAGMKYNGRNYMQQIDAYDREEEALNYLVDNIVYGSNLDDDLIGSWVTRQDAAEKWLADVFGEEKKGELSKRLQKKLNSVTLEEKQKNAGKYKDYTSNDFALPDAKKYKAEHNIGGEDEELKTWETVLDILQAGLDVAGVIPGVGVAPDLVNAAIYAIRGDWKNAGFSALVAKNAQKQKRTRDMLKLTNEATNMLQNYGENTFFNKEVIPKSYYVDEKIPDTKHGIKLSDAAIMAEVVYELSENKADNDVAVKKYNGLLGDWKYVTVISGADSAKIGVFSRPDTDTGKNEFIIVSAGTDGILDWKNNI